MDSAFKRRWDWEFIDINGRPVKADGIAFNNREEWEEFVRQLNIFIKNKHKYIHSIEDKQVGFWFINDRIIEKSTIFCPYALRRNAVQTRCIMKVFP